MSLHLRLYVVDGTVNSARAMRNCAKLRAHLPAGATIEVLTLSSSPQLAADDFIIATPALVRVSPPPLRKVIGDLSDIDAVLEELRLDGHGDEDAAAAAEG